MIQPPGMREVVLTLTFINPIRLQRIRACGRFPTDWRCLARHMSHTEERSEEGNKIVQEICLLTVWPLLQCILFAQRVHCPIGLGLWGYLSSVRDMLFYEVIVRFNFP